MTNIKVGIVEDELLIAHSIEKELTDLGYEIAGVAISYTEALGMIVASSPDILLLDIKLKGHKDGIDLAEKIREQFDIPFIFLTANADAATVKRAKECNPHAYLVKPFSRDELYAAIEVCLHNFASRGKPQVVATTDPVIKDSIFIKQGQKFQKVRTGDITHIESSGAYLYVYTQQSKYLVRNTIQGFIDQVGSPHFLRIHKSYVVNAQYIDSVSTEEMEVNKQPLPIGRAYRDEVMAFLSL